MGRLTARLHRLEQATPAPASQQPSVDLSVFTADELRELRRIKAAAGEPFDLAVLSDADLCRLEGLAIVYGQRSTGRRSVRHDVAKRSLDSTRATYPYPNRALLRVPRLARPAARMAARRPHRDQFAASLPGLRVAAGGNHRGAV